ncbi:hypothetical protein AB1Y20_011246 [Prymnesium parvum]|uniref:Uncharacterized protein n=1 Tax=Prymnesium parvum TaxID=97485 RepID=A0AB34IPJ3_PRYPA
MSLTPSMHTGVSLHAIKGALGYAQEEPSASAPNSDDEVDPSDRVSVLLKGFREAFLSNLSESNDKLAETMLDRAQGAQESYRNGEYEAALYKFAEYLAASRAMRTHKEDDESDFELKATLNSNLGACLHHLGEIELAQKYYNKSVHIFETKCYTPRWTWIVYGDINQKRIDFVKRRIQAAQQNEKPEVGKFLDTSGQEQVWEEAAAEKSSDDSYLSYLNPFSWYRYYSGATTSSTPEAAPAPAAQEAV